MAEEKQRKFALSMASRDSSDETRWKFLAWIEFRIPSRTWTEASVIRRETEAGRPGARPRQCAASFGSRYFANHRVELRSNSRR